MPPDAAEALVSDEGPAPITPPASDSIEVECRALPLVAHALEMLDEQPRVARVELEEAIRLLRRGPSPAPTSLPFDVFEASEKLRDTVGANAGMSWALRVAAALMT